MVMIVTDLRQGPESTEGAHSLEPVCNHKTESALHETFRVSEPVMQRVHSNLR